MYKFINNFMVFQRSKNYGMRFVALYRRQGSRPSPRKRNAKRQNDSLRKMAGKRREVKGKGEKEK